MKKREAPPGQQPETHTCKVSPWPFLTLQEESDQRLSGENRAGTIDIEEAESFRSSHVRGRRNARNPSIAVLNLMRPLTQRSFAYLAPDFTHYLSERPEMNSQDENSPKAEPTRKTNKMAQKKARKMIKLRDLKPTKDAKGGRGRGGSSVGNHGLYEE